MLKIFKFFKDMLLFVPLTLIFAPLSKLFLFLAYFNKLLLWIYQHKSEFIYCDYFSPLRDYTKRFKLYEFVAEHFKMEQEALTYLEFGVASGSSFKWWLTKNNNTGSGFYGFDTFEGLPEDWGGFYVKGDMSHGLPEVNDGRAAFIKGLFQDTLSRFIAENNAMLNSSKK